MAPINRLFPTKLALTAVLALLLAGCGGTDSRLNPKRFAKGWKSVESQRVTVWYPANSPRSMTAFGTLGEACDGVLAQAEKAMALRVPDTIAVYVFTTSQDCEAATGKGAGFVDGYNVFTRLGAPIGGLIAEAACTSIDPGAKSFSMIRNGLRVLFEERDKNIHQEAQTLRAAGGRWPKLADLVSPNPIDDQKAYDYACASFVSFLLQRYGSDRFKMLWRSSLELKPSLERLYGESLDSLEAAWMSHVEREAKRT